MLPSGDNTEVSAPESGGEANIPPQIPSTTIDASIRIVEADCGTQVVSGSSSQSRLSHQRQDATEIESTKDKLTSSATPLKEISYLETPAVGPNVPKKKPITIWLRRLPHIIFNKWWAWEVASLAISATFMGAVVITLVKANGTALENWGFLIQPNSMISVFMTLSKSALLAAIAECISQSKWIQFLTFRRLERLQTFDEASRGPWGSIRLLLDPRTSGVIAFSGAFLTIITLAFDPFTQQILAFPSRRVPSPTATAWVDATQVVEKINQAALQAAVIGGLYLPKKTYITYNCTTSSCHWEQPVTSLGVCGTCRNLTSIVKPECETLPGPLLPTGDEKWSFSTTTCTYAIAQNVTLPIYIQTLTLPAANGRRAEYASQYTQVKIVTPLSKALGDIIDKRIRWLLNVLSFTTFFNKDQRNLPPLTIEDLRPEVFACGLYFCAQAYNNLDVSDGTLVNTTPALSHPLYSTHDDEGKAIYLPWNGAFAELLTPDDAFKADFPGNTSFLIDHNTISAMQGTLRQVFNLTQNSGNDVFSEFPEPNFGMDGLSVSAYKNMTEAIERIADSIMGQIRVSDGSRKVPG